MMKGAVFAALLAALASDAAGAAPPLSCDASSAVLRAEQNGVAVAVVTPWPFHVNAVLLQCLRNGAGYVSVFIACPAPDGVAFRFLDVPNPQNATMVPETVIAQRDRTAIIARGKAMCAQEKTATALLVHTP
jgi:hypothetical protein